MIYLVAITIISYILSNYICQNTGEIFYNKNSSGIHDIFHDILPKLEMKFFGLRLRDVFVVLLSLVPFLFTSRKVSEEFLKKYFIIILIRCVSINLTILPNKSTDCGNEYSMTNGCYDKIFSGHFATLFLASLIYYKHGIIQNIPLLTTMNLMNVFMILSSRSHYTIDIFVAFFVTMFVFQQQI